MRHSLKKKILLAIVSGILSYAPCAYALPSQGTFDNSSSAIINMVEDKGMTVTGINTNSVINWATFDVASDEIVRFTGDKNYLNLVHGVDMSKIYGTISGGNIVYLVNPNGILFAENAVIDNIGNFVASTRNISSINKEEFLVNPGNTQGVLGMDNPVMDNKEYHPEGDDFVAKITVGDIKLTNVPDSAKIIMDGPGGVIFKSNDVLAKVEQVYTRKNGGEIGIGSETGNVNLSDDEVKKIFLVDKDRYHAYNRSDNILKGYKLVKIENMRTSYNDKDERIMTISEGKDILTATVYHPTEGTYYLEPECSPGMRLTGIDYDQNLTIFSKQSTAEQRFKLVKCDDNHDYYFIVWDSKDYGLNNHNNISQSCNNITLYNYGLHPHQEWTFYKASDGYNFIRAECDGCYMVDVSFSRREEGTQVWLEHINSTGAQKWKLIPSDRNEPTGPKVFDYSRYHGAITPSPGTAHVDINKDDNIYSLLMQQSENIKNGITDKELDAKIAYLQQYYSAELEADKGIEYVQKMLKNSNKNGNNILEEQNSINSNSQNSLEKDEDFNVMSIRGQLEDKLEDGIEKVCEYEKNKENGTYLAELTKFIEFDKDIPKEDQKLIIKAIAEVVGQGAKTLSDATGKAIPYNPGQMLEHCGNIVQAALIDLSTEVKGKTTKTKQITYYISYSQWRSTISVQYSGKTTYATINNKNQFNDALNNYCVSLMQLNSKAWLNVIEKCLNKSGNLSPNKTTELASDIIVYLSMPEDTDIQRQKKQKYENDLKRTIFKELENYASKEFESAIKGIVKDYIPNGSNILKAADSLKQTYSKYESWANLSEELKDTNKPAYKDYQVAYHKTEELLNNLNN